MFSFLLIPVTIPSIAQGLNPGLWMEWWNDHCHQVGTKADLFDRLNHSILLPTE